MRVIDADRLRSDISNGVSLRYFMGRNIDKAFGNLQKILQCVDNAPDVHAYTMDKIVSWINGIASGKAQTVREDQLQDYQDLCRAITKIQEARNV